MSEQQKERSAERLAKFLKPASWVQMGDHSYYNRAPRIDSQRPPLLAFAAGGQTASATLDLFRGMALQNNDPVSSLGSTSATRTSGHLAWVRDLYSLVGQGRHDDAIDVLFSTVNRMFVKGEFAKCDEALRAIDVARLDTNLLVGVLTSTLCAAEHLPSRNDVIHRVENRLRQLAPDRVERLLANLR